MTAAEWDASVSAHYMLRRLLAPDVRKVRLFWAACVRRVYHAANASRLLVALVENDPGGTNPRLRAEVEAIRRRFAGDNVAAAHPTYWELGVFLDSPAGPLVHLAHHVISLAGERALWRADALHLPAGSSGIRSDAEIDESASLCDLVREVFGNPFRPTDFSPWRTDTVLAMARDLYDHREYSGMPILADALQDAGCEDEHVLSHCREDREHVRGCWVLDGLLGQ